MSQRTKKHCWSSQTLAQWKGRVWCAVMKHSVHDVSYEMQSSHWTSRFLTLPQEQVLEATGFASRSRMCWVRRGMIFMNASKSTDIWLFGSVNYRGLHKMKPTCVFFLGGSSSGLVEVVSACSVFSAGWGIEPSAERRTWTRWGSEARSTKDFVWIPVSVMMECLTRRVCFFVWAVASSCNSASAAFLFFKLGCLGGIKM